MAAGRPSRAGDVAVVQGLLQLSGHYNGRVDGLVGPATRAAVAQNPDIEKVAETYGVTVSEIVKPVGSGVASDDVLSAIKQASIEFGLDYNVMLGKAKIESSLDPLATRGSYRGLFQMGSPAWADATAVAAEKGIDIGEYRSSWQNPLQNSRAAAAYQIALSRQVTAAGWRAQLSEGQKYLAHQQGAGGLVRLLKAMSGQTLQPADASSMLKAMRSNPPPDKLGVTVDPKEFVTRWEDVVRKRYASA